MKLKDLETKIEKEKKEKVCSICNGKGYVFDGAGKDVHVCWKCLAEGRFSS